MQNKERNINSVNGKTITFYSYKGGVGRSMALVNIACLMAKQKKKVLLIDWDLEAPGLLSFFNDSIKDEGLGLVDLIIDVKQFINKDSNNTEEGYNSFLTEQLDKYIFKNLQKDKSKLQIDIIKAGKFDDNYTAKLNSIDWHEFYKKSPAFFRTFAQFLEQKYDYILIDSRTGLADTSGVCTMLMPQILVLVFALNNQNIDGAIDVAKQSIDYRFNSNDYRNLNILPLPSRIDDENPTELRKWTKIYTEKFETVFKELYLLDKCALENYFNIAKIPYKPIYAYGENIPVLIEKASNDFYISFHYAQFLKLIEDSTSIWDLLTIDQLDANRSQAYVHFQKGIECYYSKDYENACLEFEKSCVLDSSNYSAFNNWGGAILNLAKSKNDEALYLEIFEKFKIATELNPKGDSAYNNWGNAICYLAKSKNDEALYLESFEKYKTATELNQKNDSAYDNWGTSIYELAKLRNDETLYLQSFEKFITATELNSTEDSTYNNWGNAICGLAKFRNDEALYLQSFEKFKTATELNPKDDSAYNNWGNAIYELAKQKDDKALYLQSFEKYKTATELSPKDDSTYYNWGNSISEFAKLSNDETLFLQSFEKFKTATELNPKKDSAYYNWGASIYELAKLRNDEPLYLESFEKYKTATELNPKNDSAYNNWGTAIYKLAKLRNDETLYQESFEKFKTATKLNPKKDSAYNNWGSAIFALAKQKDDESLYLESFEKFKIVTELNPKDDSAYYNWGTSIYELAKLRNDETLYQQSFEKFKIASELDPKDKDVFNNWGSALFALAKLQNNEALYEECFEKLNKAIELGASSYNLACAYAVKNDKEKALTLLEYSLMNKEIEPKYVAKDDDDWKDYQEDADFIALIMKYS